MSKATVHKNVIATADHNFDSLRPREKLLAGRALARLEAAAEAVHACANGNRGLQAVSSKDGFSAVIKHGKTLIEISGDDFAVRQSD